LIALEVLEHGLIQVGGAVDAIHDLPRARRLAGLLDRAIAEPPGERSGLVRVPEPEQGVHGE
jgi:hypothetical protein